MQKRFAPLLLTLAIIGMGLSGAAQGQTAPETNPNNPDATPPATTPAKQPNKQADKKTADRPTSKDGFYLAPEQFGVFFIDKAFTRGLGKRKVSMGLAWALGYKIKNFIIDVNVDYQAFSLKGATSEVTSENGSQWFTANMAGNAFLQGYNTAIQQGKSNNEAVTAGGDAALKLFAETPSVGEKVVSAIDEQRALITNAQEATTIGLRNARRGGYSAYHPDSADDIVPGISTVTTDINSREAFFPVTLGVRYAFAIAPKNMFSLSPGLAAGVWIHTVRRNLSTTIYHNYTGVSISQSSTDKATQVRAVIVPSLSLDYNPWPSMNISLVGKFYLVPNGYSDNYSAAQQAAQAIAATNKSGYRMSDAQDNAYLDNNTLPLGLSPARNATNKFLWYGGVNLVVQYIF
ncbi:MAG: hypothetical protein QM529_04190 [Hydrotalea sp.]|nr:hypothetical protein [Hydrotalea sp.]